MDKGEKIANIHMIERQSSSSYECDGCTHHASFHSMENKTEDEIRRRWEQEASEKEKARRELESVENRPRKRVRQIEYATGARAETSGTVTPEDQAVGGGVKKRGARSAVGSANSRKKGNGVGREDELWVELD